MTNKNTISQEEYESLVKSINETVFRLNEHLEKLSNSICINKVKNGDQDHEILDKIQ